MSEDLPVACALTPAELAAMRNGLLPGLVAEASASEPVPGGIRWRFDARGDLLTRAAAVIAGRCGSK